MFLEVNAISLQFGSTTVLDSVSLALDKNQTGCLLGPSGCGKTSLLRCIAGLETPTAGSINHQGQPITPLKNNATSIERSIGMVPQDLALFPHLTVAEHVIFSIQHEPAAHQKKIVAELLEITNLGTEKDRYPHQLSGGQQKRVALARALAHQPDLLLLDEPFSNIDHELQQQLLKEVTYILSEREMCALLVTHDKQEAFTFAEYCGVMNNGAMLQWDTCYQLYHQPASPKIATLLGEGSFLAIDSFKDNVLSVANGAIKITSATEIAPNAKYLFIRPDDIHHSTDGSYRYPIIAKEFQGPFICYTLALPNSETILCYIRSHINLPIGDELPFMIDMQHCICYPDKE